ncbi:MAG TPA: alginate export family protein [Candidatus Omnitrophota bacterium]|nr:alginate export family protein [Candidatus Omnitrophota bacterium]HPS20724.1 alginate export family protein [Candidatus Omnitrophota bacterium]
MKFLKIMLAIAMVMSISTVSFAETQTVKVSGDINSYAFARDNYNLNRDTAAAATGVPTDNSGSNSTSWQSYELTTTEVQVAADLTDNVSGVVKLFNQRMWGSSYDSSEVSGLGMNNLPFNDQVSERTVASDDAFNVNVELAYVELKEFLYSPLTLKIGRQDLWFGKGFIVGANMQDPDGSLIPYEYTVDRGFDAIRATLDYNPWTIDGIAAKINENAQLADDDTNLFGVNVGYVFDAYNAEAEAYWFMKQQRFTGSEATALVADVQNGVDSNDVHTIGMRGSMDPIEDWTLALEGAYQFGNYVGVDAQNEDRGRSAFAIDASAECRWLQNKFAWKPVGKLEYIFYSGEENLGSTGLTSANGEYHGWDSMYRGKFDTAIREYQNVYYVTAMSSCPSSTNQHQVLVSGSIQPTDSLTCSATYGVFWLQEKYTEDPVAGVNTDKKFVGQEVDLNTVWDYTEDVSFGLLCAWFVPGDHFSSEAGNDVATDIVGSVKLSF